jgi:hypothetical protein
VIIRFVRGGRSDGLLFLTPSFCFLPQQIIFNTISV